MNLAHLAGQRDLHDRSGSGRLIAYATQYRRYGSKRWIGYVYAGSHVGGGT